MRACQAGERVSLRRCGTAKSAVDKGLQVVAERIGDAGGVEVAFVALGPRPEAPAGPRRSARPPTERDEEEWRSCGEAPLVGGTMLVPRMGRMCLTDEADACRVTLWKWQIRHEVWTQRSE